MKRIAVEIAVEAPFEVVRQFVKEAAEDQSLAQAYWKLRGTTSPSRVVASTSGRVAIYEPAFDPSIRAHGMLRTGWTVTYALKPGSPAETLVEIAVTYSRMTAIMGMGLVKAQAENEIIHRVSALLAFESGYHTERTQAAELENRPLLEARDAQQHIGAKAGRKAEEASRRK